MLNVSVVSKAKHKVARKLNSPWTWSSSDLDDCRAIAVKGDVARRGRGGLIDVDLKQESGHDTDVPSCRSIRPRQTCRVRAGASLR